MVADPVLSLQARAEIARRRDRAYLNFIEALVPSPASLAAGYKPTKSQVTAIAESYALEIFNIEQEHYPRGDQERLRSWLEGLSRSIQDEMVQLLYAGTISGSVPRLVMRTLYHDDELRRIVANVLQDRIEEIPGSPPSTENVTVRSEVDPAESGSNSPTVFVGNKKGAKVRRHRRIRDQTLAEQRCALLADYQKRMRDKFGLETIRARFGVNRIPHAAIYSQAGEEKSEFYRWRTGELPEGSQTQQNIESVLKATTLPPSA